MKERGHYYLYIYVVFRREHACTYQLDAIVELIRGAKEDLINYIFNEYWVVSRICTEYTMAFYTLEQLWSLGFDMSRDILLGYSAESDYVTVQIAFTVGVSRIVELDYVSECIDIIVKYFRGYSFCCGGYLVSNYHHKNLSRLNYLYEYYEYDF
jgi:hypothetical protein